MPVDTCDASVAPYLARGWIGVQSKASPNDTTRFNGTGTERQARLTNLEFPGCGFIGMTAKSDKWTLGRTGERQNLVNKYTLHIRSITETSCKGRVDRGGDVQNLRREVSVVTGCWVLLIVARSYTPGNNR